MIVRFDGGALVDGFQFMLVRDWVGFGQAWSCPWGIAVRRKVHQLETQGLMLGFGQTLVGTLMQGLWCLIFRRGIVGGPGRIHICLV